MKEFDVVLDSLHAILAENQLNDKQQMRLLNALGQLDSANAQRFLVNVLNKPYASPNTQFRALRALSFGQSALSNEAYLEIQTLIANGVDSNDASMTASFFMTLGIMLNNREVNSIADSLNTDLKNRLSSSSKISDISGLVSALGNSRRDDNIDLVVEYAEHQDAQVQKSSARALGMMQKPKAHQHLSKMLNNKYQENVTEAVISAIGQYEISEHEMNTVYDFASSSSNDKIRYAAISALANQNKNQELIKKQLKTLLPNETSKRNFKAIINTLHRKE